MTAALAFENVDILFTGLQGRKREAAIKAALASLDQGRSRAEIQAASGVVVGVAGASLSVEQGEIFGADGALGIRQVDAAACGEWTESRDPGSRARDRGRAAGRRRAAATRRRCAGCGAAASR